MALQRLGGVKSPLTRTRRPRPGTALQGQDSHSQLRKLSSSPQGSNPQICNHNVTPAVLWKNLLELCVILGGAGFQPWASLWGGPRAPV